MFNNKDTYVKEKHSINTLLNDGPVFEIPKPNSEMIKNNGIYSGALHWNNLDPAIRNINPFTAKHY